jgi:hypothetical protein
MTDVETGRCVSRTLMSATFTVWHIPISSHRRRSWGCPLAAAERAARRRRTFFIVTRMDIKHERRNEHGHDSG